MKFKTATILNFPRPHGRGSRLGSIDQEHAWLFIRKANLKLTKLKAQIYTKKLEWLTR